jgi:hypothetical protein
MNELFGAKPVAEFLLDAFFLQNIIPCSLAVPFFLTKLLKPGREWTTNEQSCQGNTDRIIKAGNYTHLYFLIAALNSAEFSPSFYHLISGNYVLYLTNCGFKSAKDVLHLIICGFKSRNDVLYSIAALNPGMLSFMLSFATDCIMQGRDSLPIYLQYLQ